MSSSPPVGSAMEALHSIQNFLKGRPKSFKSMDHAIEWRWALTFTPGQHKQFLQPLSATTQRKNWSTDKSFFLFLAWRADKSGTWNLPKSQWLVRLKGRLADWLADVSYCLSSVGLYHSMFTSCLLDVRWRRPTLWSRPARYQTWSSSAVKSSMIRATSTTKRTLPQRWASTKARYENDHTETLMVIDFH